MLITTFHIRIRSHVQGMGYKQTEDANKIDENVEEENDKENVKKEEIEEKKKHTKMNKKETVTMTWPAFSGLHKKNRLVQRHQEHVVCASHCYE